MIFHKLTLNNVGLFRGRQTLSLTPNNRNPIILIGGMNGAGKTTLLDSVRLCLYGRRALGNRVSLKEYHDYLAAMIHRPSDSATLLDSASISLEFEYAQGGETKRYQIERTWRLQDLNRRTVSEGLVISENGLLSTEIGINHWQDYIHELIPIGVSQFFFFDGEDIQRLADDSSHDQYLAESIKVLLGLNLVDRLRSDLRIYANRLLKQGSPVSLTKEIEAVESDIVPLERALTQAEAHTETVDVKIGKLEVQITRQEARIAAEGGGYAEKRESLKLQEGQLLADIEALENAIRKLCGGLFPFTLAPGLLKKLAVRLHKEIELAEWESKNRVLESQNSELLETVTSGSFWEDVPLSEEQIDVVRTKITPLLKTQQERPEQLRGFEKKTDRFPAEYGHLLGWIDSSLNETPQEFRRLNETLKEAQLELQKVEQALQKVPTEGVLRPLVEKLSALNQKLGQLHKQKQEAEQSVRNLSYQLEAAKRNLEKLRYDQQLGEVHVQRQKRVENVQSVLSTYTTLLTKAKIDMLGTAIVEGFNQLSHKPDRIKRVEIDPRTFAVTLYDASNRSISKDELSAGEKQIYTTALLWGLAKTSGRALPMILDTPLGRLDSGHRQLLIERYFPHASHQIVLLSTDTEVDKDLYVLLKPHLSHTFHLVYRQAEAYTSIEKGYFGETLCD